MVTYLPILQIYQDVCNTAGEIRTNSCDILLWAPTHGQVSVDHLTRTYLHQLCADTGCCLEDLQGSIGNLDRWWESVSWLWLDILASYKINQSLKYPLHFFQQINMFFLKISLENWPHLKCYFFMFLNILLISFLFFIFLLFSFFYKIVIHHLDFDICYVQCRL